MLRQLKVGVVRGARMYHRWNRARGIISEDGWRWRSTLVGRTKVSFLNLLTE